MALLFDEVVTCSIVSFEEFHLINKIVYLL